MARKAEDISSFESEDTSSLENDDRVICVSFTECELRKLKEASEVMKEMAVQMKKFSALSVNELQIEKWQLLQQNDSVPVKLISNEEHEQQVSALKKALRLEQRKSTSLYGELKNLQAQYDTILRGKNIIAQELEEAYFKVGDLHTRLKRLTCTNRSLEKAYDEIERKLNSIRKIVL